jgi:dihydrofolate synthase/folylpolyglutamate synthase
MPSYDDCLQYLDTFVNYEQRPPDAPPPRSMGLGRVAALLEALGAPQTRLKCLHVAGTKGKGSTAAMISSILTASGYTTGLYTSPHLVDVRERIRLNGEMIPEEAFSRMMARTRPHLDTILAQIAQLPPGATLRRPTYFEIMTHVAFLYFEEARADACVLEVGMGGRLDATNIIEHPVACAITNISMDHTAILGGTLGQIAREKAGILKENAPAVVSPQRPAAAKSIKTAARKVHAPLWWVGSDVRIEPGEGERFSIRLPGATFDELTVPLLGSHQRENAAVATGLAELARRSGYDRITPDTVRRGLATVEWPGRIQQIDDNPTTIIDGAHNPESVVALVMTLAAAFPGVRAAYVFAVSDDKDWRCMLRKLAPGASAITFTLSGNPRSVPPDELAAAARKMRFASIQVDADPAHALRQVRESAGRDGLVVAVGSLYLVGSLLREYRDARRQDAPAGQSHGAAAETAKAAVSVKSALAAEPRRGSRV